MFETQPTRLSLGIIREEGDFIYYEYCNIGIDTGISTSNSVKLKRNLFSGTYKTIIKVMI